MIVCVAEGVVCCVVEIVVKEGKNFQCSKRKVLTRRRVLLNHTPLANSIRRIAHGERSDHAVGGALWSALTVIEGSLLNGGAYDARGAQLGEKHSDNSR